VKTAIYQLQEAMQCFQFKIVEDEEVDKRAKNYLTIRYEGEHGENGCFSKLGMDAYRREQVINTV
jgi:hypothetical protein